MNHSDQGFPHGRITRAGTRLDGTGRVPTDGTDRARGEGAGGRHRPAGRRRRGTHGRGRSGGSNSGDRSRGSFARELPLLVLVAVGLALLIKAFLIQAFYIPSASMERTLREGDRVLVNKLAYDLHRVHRGDVIVFSGAGSFRKANPDAQPDNPVEVVLQTVGSAFGIAPSGQKDFIKRVIGLPGDRVACCDTRGRVTVNGVPLNGAPYLFSGDVPSQQEFKVTVPPGRLWVMGDHRSASKDSREYLEKPNRGTVPVDKVVGRAFVVVWPPSHVQVLQSPRTFQQPALDESTSYAATRGAATRPSAIGPAASAQPPPRVPGGEAESRQPHRAGSTLES